MIQAQQFQLRVPRSDSIKHEAIQILINNLGLTKVSFFIRDNLSTQSDYLDMKEKLFGDKTAAEIYKEMKKSTTNWKNHNE
ncbi:hypothetical protein [Candidatus Parabeggiatoa sp. HSG14]|uniref:hypothetical protein n=1 Tax=Candidatus Parabeggiatoa sp. HSG14 TaxID=3055593 RepID=UPI0025A87CB8|nr:hypothetical protein [Thiotrichales bacterium HSG14]